MIDWCDDNISNWIGYYKEQIITVAHSWQTESNSSILAKVKERYHLESDWETLEVSMPKNKAINTPFLLFLERLMKRFPILEQILQLILVYLGQHEMGYRFQTS